MLSCWFGIGIRSSAPSRQTRCRAEKTSQAPRGESRRRAPTRRSSSALHPSRGAAPAAVKSRSGCSAPVIQSNARITSRDRWFGPSPVSTCGTTKTVSNDFAHPIDQLLLDTIACAHAWYGMHAAGKTSTGSPRRRARQTPRPADARPRRPCAGHLPRRDGRSPASWLHLGLAPSPRPALRLAGPARSHRGSLIPGTHTVYRETGATRRPPNSDWSCPSQTVSTSADLTHAFENARLQRDTAYPSHSHGKLGWGGRIRTYDTRYQKPLPYHLATPQRCALSYPNRPCAASPKIGRAGPIPGGGRG